MFLYALMLLFIFNSVTSKTSYTDLDEDDEEFFRTAYNTLCLNNECLDEDFRSDKIDLINDGFWALKAKIHELKEFNKALAEKLRKTKLKLKQLYIATINENREAYEGLKKEKKIKYQVHEPSYSQYQAIPHGYDPYIRI